jgi:hypothetical protein
MRTAALFLGVTISILAICGRGQLSTWSELRHLVRSGRQTVGKVVSKEPKNHNSVFYEYVVEHKTYPGNGVAGHGGIPSLDEMPLGSSIPVTYLPDAPSISVPGDPADFYGSVSISLFGVLPLFSLLAATAVVLQSKGWFLKRGLAHA